MKVSVIVPVYNVEKYLSKCINSILAQSFSDYELILVNDCSTDGSLDICRRYASKDRRVKIIDKARNEGLDKARFDGLAVSAGEYVMFVDSDDYMPKDSISVLLATARRHDVDMVIGRIRQVGLNGLLRLNYFDCTAYSGRKICHEELMRDFYLSFFGCNILPCNAYGRLYRKSLILRSGVTPGYYTFGEDIMFNMKVFPHIDSLYIIADTVYNYRIGSGFTSKFMPDWMSTIKREYAEKKAAIQKYGVDKARFYVRVELMNCLVFHVEQHIRNGYSSGECRAMLAAELVDTVYDDLRDIASVCKNKELAEAILRRDADAVYMLVKSGYEHAPLRRKASRMLRRMLSKIMA